MKATSTVCGEDLVEAAQRGEGSHPRETGKHGLVSRYILGVSGVVLWEPSNSC